MIHMCLMIWSYSHISFSIIQIKLKEVFNKKEGQKLQQKCCYSGKSDFTHPFHMLEVLRQNYQNVGTLLQLSNITIVTKYSNDMWVCANITYFGGTTK